MHGLINRAIERFARDTYGDAFWHSVTQTAGLDFETFEAMLIYDHILTEKVLSSLTEQLDRSSSDVLEDIGTYLVTTTRSVAVRRLLRFGGTDFVDFLYSLDDLPARVRLAVPELNVPQLELRQHTAESFSLSVSFDPDFTPVFGHLIVGLLRAIADDYGALVLLKCKSGLKGQELIEITLLEEAFARARDFELGAKAG